MNSPFNQEQAELLNRLLPTLTESQKAWLSGFLAASQSFEAAAALETPAAEIPAAEPVQPVSKEVTILYGSQTGNAQGLAENAGKKLEERGFQVTVSSMSDFKANQLKKYETCWSSSARTEKAIRRIMPSHSMSFFMADGLLS